MTNALNAEDVVKKLCCAGLLERAKNKHWQLASHSRAPLNLQSEVMVPARDNCQSLCGITLSDFRMPRFVDESRKNRLLDPADLGAVAPA
jgi:hypothetical protein